MKILLASSNGICCSIYVTRDHYETVTSKESFAANITASLTTAEGLALTDTEAVTVAIPVVPPPTPVLSSIKVAFA